MKVSVIHIGSITTIINYNITYKMEVAIYEDTFNYISSIAVKNNFPEMGLVPFIAMLYTHIPYGSEQLILILLKNANTLKIGYFKYFIADYKLLMSDYLKVQLSSVVIENIESREDWCFPKSSYCLSQFMKSELIEFGEDKPAKLDYLVDYINITMLQILEGSKKMTLYEKKMRELINSEKIIEVENLNTVVRVPPRKQRRLNPTDILYYEED